MIERSPPADQRLLAPPDFLAALRGEMEHADLHCWWQRGVSRLTDEKRGAWVVWQKRNSWRMTDVDGVRLHYLESVWVSLFTLNGNNGNPLTLGPWVIEALVVSRADRTDAARRVESLANAQAEEIMRVERERNDEVDYRAKSPRLRAAMALLGQGTQPIALKEEVIAGERRVERRRERRWKQAEAHANDVSGALLVNNR